MTEVSEAVPATAPDLPSAKWRAILRVLKRLPQAGLSRGFGRIADLRIPKRLRPRILGAVADALGIDLGEAERPLVEYRSMNELFVRRLKPGLRRWPAEATVVVSPVDGVVGQSGVIDGGRLIQAKGRHYTAGALLDDEAEAARYQAGHFVTIYLSPRHYHRIHTPVPGEVRLARHVPGALLPVNAAAVQHVENLFATNERLVTYVDGALGRVAAVAVGAYNVGRISAAYDPSWSGTPGTAVTNRRHAVAETRRYDPPKRLDAGAEIMVFHLGSTVVLLFEPGRVALDTALLVPGTEVLVGQPIARAP